MAVVGAELLYNLHSHGWRSFWRVLFTVPLIIPTTVVFLIWRRVFAGDIGLMFIDYLPREEALEYLKQQLAERNAELDNFPQALPPDHAGHLSIQLAFDHLLTMRRANRDWLAATIERLAQSEQH